MCPFAVAWCRSRNHLAASNWCAFDADHASGNNIQSHQSANNNKNKNIVAYTVHYGCTARTTLQRNPKQIDRSRRSITNVRPSVCRGKAMRKYAIIGINCCVSCPKSMENLISRLMQIILANSEGVPRPLTTQHRMLFAFNCGKRSAIMRTAHPFLSRIASFLFQGKIHRYKCRRMSVYVLDLFGFVFCKRKQVNPWAGRYIRSRYHTRDLRTDRSWPPNKLLTENGADYEGTIGAACEGTLSVAYR